MNSIWLTVISTLLWLVGGATNNLTVLQLLENIVQQDNFNYLLFMRNQNASVSTKFMTNEAEKCFARNLMEKLSTPLIQLDERVNYFLYGKHGSRLLTIFYVMNSNWLEHETLFKSLIINLHIATTGPVVFMVQLPQADVSLLNQLFAFCWQMKLINVLALFEDFEITNRFYSYTQFPSYQLEQRIFEPDTIIYPQRLRNLQGANVSVVIGGSTPRIISHYNKQGKIIVKGSVGHFMDVFQQKYNCKFIQPYLPFAPNVTRASQDLMLAVRNGTVDISLAITYPSTFPIRGYTYPYEQMHWCLMLPVEADIPQSEYYIMVFELKAFLLTLVVMVLISLTLTLALRLHGYEVNSHDFVLHENCLRGALGQSFYEVFRAPLLVRGIYLKICVLGILLTAWYNSYFSAFVTSSPKEPPYGSLDDVLAGNLKIVAWQPEYNELVGRVAEFRKYRPMFWIEPSLSRYLNMRDSFNTKYGYMMTTTKWVVMNEQQKVFTKPIFRMRGDFCVFHNIPVGFPVHENSIYMQPLESLILDLSATGLISYWISKGFAELVEAGELHFVDLTPRREFRAMQYQDLQYIWYGYGFMVVVSSTVWLLEILWNRVEQRVRRKLNKRNSER